MVGGETVTVPDAAPSAPSSEDDVPLRLPGNAPLPTIDIDSTLLEFVSSQLEHLVKGAAGGAMEVVRGAPAWNLLVACARERRMGYEPAQFAESVRQYLQKQFQDLWLDELLEKAFPLELELGELIDLLSSM